MFKVFSTREVAVGIYGLLAIILACTNKKIRITVIGVVKAACQKPFLVLFFWVWMYVTGIIYCMCELHLWKWVFLKDVFIWVVFAGVPLSFKAAWRKVEEGFFRTMIRENLKLVVLVEFDASDGLLEFSEELPFLECDYVSILQEHYDLLVRIKKIRNKFEHRMHGANIVASGSGSISLFDVTYEIGNQDIDLKASELIALVEDINGLFSKIQQRNGYICI